MKPWRRSGPAALLAGLVVAALAIVWAVGAVERRAAAQQDKDKVARMTQKMKTVCIGRFLIDLPDETRLELRRPRIHGFDISSVDEQQADFQVRLARREAELRAAPDQFGGNRNLESVREVKTDNGVVGKIFVHGRKVTEGTQANGLALERYRDEGVAIEAMVHGQGTSFALAANNYNPDNIDNLPRLVAKLVPNPRNQIPTEPGFCIDRAWFRDPLTPHQREQVMMSAQLPSHPDIEFLTILAAGNKPASQGLLERAAATQATSTLAEQWRISTLRAAPRTIGGVTGDELVKRVAEMNDTVGYSFWWEAGGTEDNVLAPHFVFKMTTGEGADEPVPTSLSEDAAMALWDKISSSIRLRPSEPPRPVAAVPPPTPLGTYAWAGDRCPESGWWSCSAGGNGIGVLGGQRQYIAKGERMPQALLLPPQTLWEKLRGVQPSFESQTQTSWKLVDKRNRKRVPSPLPLAQATPAASASITTAGTGPSVMEQQRVPVGSFAATGLACPASGWWRCEDPRALDGTRWFALGSLLPPATFAVPPGAFGRPAHAARSIERRGAWRLVRLATAPGEQVGAGAGAGDPGGETGMPNGA
ncbi:T6SS immunity protein Tli4 family protein [Massilia jejuensis]|uniref:T6SS immunity protein Tli4 family protein n=1 Tax=Massilia jejuensis TaxID=648894 RepID=A0ABW0PCB1_9BURK